jgi:PAS domain-containing protein
MYMARIAKTTNILHSPPMTQLYEKLEVIERCGSIARSFERLLGRSLLQQKFSNAADLARALFEAPFVLVSHDHLPDPIFRFANRKALELWNTPVEEFIGMPSSHSAEPGERKEREDFLARVKKDDFVEDYRGIRKAKDGQRFMIENVIVWNVYDDAEKYIGQAAMFTEWTPLPD